MMSWQALIILWFLSSSQSVVSLVVVKMNEDVPLASNCANFMTVIEVKDIFFFLHMLISLVKAGILKN